MDCERSAARMETVVVSLDGNILTVASKSLIAVKFTNQVQLRLFGPALPRPAS